MTWLVAATGGGGGRQLLLEMTSTRMQLVPLDVAVLQLADAAATRVERLAAVQYSPVVEADRLT